MQHLLLALPGWLLPEQKASYRCAALVSNKHWVCASGLLDFGVAKWKKDKNIHLFLCVRD